MTVRSFDDDAREATTTELPVPRGIAFRYLPPGRRTVAVNEAQAAVARVLSGWQVMKVAGLPNWFEATPPADANMPATPPSQEAQPLALGTFWETLRKLRELPGVREAEPLLLVTVPTPSADPALNPFATPYGFGERALWGRPYDRKTNATKQQNERVSDWHLTQMKVRDAWTAWLTRHPDREPGDGILVAHPDTGFTNHPEIRARLASTGRSFLRDGNGNEEADARDTLQRVGDIIPEFPGHGTATASVIASGKNDPTTGNAQQVFGAAPGATLLPLRVSRSVIHFDFSNVGRAILFAVQQNADVISMSLGGPLNSAFVHRCIQEARKQGVIVVAAAGNEIPTTVFPAAFPEVIAVAATHAAASPWRYSGLGPLVDIAAPGEEVWCARSSLDGSGERYTSGQGTGTSFATANVAGLAALWLSYHGGRDAIATTAYGGERALVPIAFQFLLTETADKSARFVKNGRHGAGIPDAVRLLAAPLPAEADLRDFSRKIQKQTANKLTFLSGLLSGWRGVTERGTIVTPNGRTDAAVRTALADQGEIEAMGLLNELLGASESESNGRPSDLIDELAARIAGDRALLVGLSRWQNGDSLLPIFDRLLGPKDDPLAAASTKTLSLELRRRLADRRDKERKRLEPLHRARLTPPISWASMGDTPAERTSDTPPIPAYRQLRAYAFDPSLDTKLETAPINQVTVATRWEELAPGPVGEYLEVIDIDPASGCVYAPVDLNHPHILAQDGLAPSEGNPQFHQQMVYAVAMNTINRFELALGRPIFWSSIRPWLAERSAEADNYTPEAEAMIERLSVDEPASSGGEAPRAPGRNLQTLHDRDRYVQRLRIYPHALRDTNAYYSPSKRALLFGYFPAADDDSGKHYPGGTVFTCLSQDIITHEVTHALLDGMHPFFNEPTNEDVGAFHEAFADIMALFQHFTYPEVLRHQIANTRGDLRTDNLLGELAQQFGQTTSGRSALRSYLGGINEEGVWERSTPDPHRLRDVRRPHERGSVLVAAVFDAFLALYNDRVADLLRIYTGGTGVLPAGSIHPDLVNRLAVEAATAAEEILRVCIRALDYVPPIDITFGEFLRALITADYDLSPIERRKNRIAFIDAFRAWGIYPRDVRTLSEETLRWRAPDPSSPLTNLTRLNVTSSKYRMHDTHMQALESIIPALNAWQPRADTAPVTDDPRGRVFGQMLSAQAVINSLLRDMQKQVAHHPLLPGLDLRGSARFSVSNLRPARRIGVQGAFQTEMVVEVVQSLPSQKLPDQKNAPDQRGLRYFRGGATLVVDLRNWDIRYIIYKRLYERLPTTASDAGIISARYERQRAFEGQLRTWITGDARSAWRGEDGDDLTRLYATTYASERDADRRTAASRLEPFAFLHRALED